MDAPRAQTSWTMDLFATDELFVTMVVLPSHEAMLAAGLRRMEALRLRSVGGGMKIIRRNFLNRIPKCNALSNLLGHDWKQNVVQNPKYQKYYIRVGRSVGAGAHCHENVNHLKTIKIECFCCQTQMTQQENSCAALTLVLSLKALLRLVLSQNSIFLNFWSS